MYTLHIVASERRLSQITLPGSDRRDFSTAALRDGTLGDADTDSDDSEGESLGLDLDDNSQAIEFTAGNPRVEHITGVVHLYRPTPGRLPQNVTTSVPLSGHTPNSTAPTTTAATPQRHGDSTAAMPALADAPPAKGAPTSWASLLAPPPPPGPPPRPTPAAEPCDELCCLALPSDMTIADFCSFLGAHLLRLRRMRVLRRQVGPVGGHLHTAATAAALAASAAAAGGVGGGAGGAAARPRSGSSGGCSAGGGGPGSSCGGGCGECVPSGQGLGKRLTAGGMLGPAAAEQEAARPAGAAAANDAARGPSSEANTNSSTSRPRTPPLSPTLREHPSLPLQQPPLSQSNAASAAAATARAVTHPAPRPASQRVVCMVVLRMESPEAADELYNDLNGRPFSSLEPDVVCRLVYVRQVEVISGGGGGGSSPDTAAAAAPPPPPHTCSSSPPPPPGQTELPTCPVCLERLDEHVSGIVTTVCNHMFHSECLQKWADTSCPVCRYCVQGAGSTSRCGVCGTTVDLWICLICGHVGCGRYRAGHAADHWRTSGHCYALELETQRVWDYVGDNYVHRLIQSKTDGKLVELAAPAASTASPHAGGGAGGGGGGHRHADGVSCGAVGGGGGDGRGGGGGGGGGRGARGGYGMDGDGGAGGSGVSGGGGGPGWSSADEELKEALLASKLDAIAAEYNHLLASQLDSQRQYYEGLLAQAALEADHRCSQAGAAADKARTEADEAQAAAREEARRRHAAERKAAETAEQLRTVRQEAEFLRSLNETLLANQRDLKQHLAAERARAEAAEAAAGELREQVRDLAFFIEAQRAINDSGDGELREGTVLPLPAQGSGGSRAGGRGGHGASAGSRAGARGGGSGGRAGNK